MMNEPTLLWTVIDEQIGVVTFNRPHVRNALDLATMRAFAEQVNAIHHMPAVRVVIVTGAGTQSFCSGGDLTDLATLTTEDGAREFTHIMQGALSALENLPIPVIAAINGFALGGGSEIAVACDLRVIDENTRIGFVQAKRGLIPGWGGGQRLLRLVGYTRGLEILLDAQPMLPAQLQTLGLVNRVVPAGEVYPAALEWARQLTQLDAQVLRAIKQLARANLVQSEADAFATEADLFPALWVGDAHRQAMQAFNQRTRKHT